MAIRNINLTLSTYVGEGIEQTCTNRQLTERDFTPTQLAALAHIVVNAGFDPVPPRSVPTLVPAVAAAASHMLQPVTPQPAGDRAAAAKQQGFTGDSCNDCGSFAVKRTGKCTTCEACGATGGCG